MPKLLNSSSAQTIADAKQIVPEHEIWVGVKITAPLQEVQFGEYTGYATSKGEVISLGDLTWNDILAMSRLNLDVLSTLPKSKFDTPTVDNTRCGLFEDVFKRGYAIRPLNGYRDFQNRPIVLVKGNK